MNQARDAVRTALSLVTGMPVDRVDESLRLDEVVPLGPARARLAAVLCDQVGYDLDVVRHDSSAHLRIDKVVDEVAAELDRNCVVRLPERRPDRAALVYFHCIHGHVYALWQLDGRLGRTVVGVRAAGIEGEQAIPRTVPDMIDVYVEHLRRSRVLRGPVVLAGFSSGGVLAAAAATRLSAAGHDVRGCLMIDTLHPSLLRDHGRRQTVTELVHDRIATWLDEIGDTCPDRTFTFSAEEDGWRIPPNVLMRLLGEDADPEAGAQLERELESLAYSTHAYADYDVAPLGDVPARIVDMTGSTENVDAWRRDVPHVETTRYDGVHFESRLLADDGFAVLLEELLSRLDG